MKHKILMATDTVIFLSVKKDTFSQFTDLLVFCMNIGFGFMAYQPL